MDGADLLLALAVAVTALVAAVLGGVTGMGTGIVTLPVLAFAFGVREAVPIVSVAMLFNTAARAWASRESIDYRVVGWHAIGAVPGAALGGAVFANTPADLLARALGVFLLALVVWRHVPLGRGGQMRLHAFAPVGAGQGFLSAIFGGAGPFGAHFFLSYGLMRNAFVGTMAVSTFGMNVTKTIVYGGFALIDARLLAIGAGVGLVMAVGAFAGASLVRRMSDRAFAIVVEAAMVIAGIALIVQG